MKFKRLNCASNKPDRNWTLDEGEEELLFQSFGSYLHR